MNGIMKVTHVGESLIPRKLPRTRSYLNPTLAGTVAFAAEGGERRCPGGRLTKIPYFRGGGRAGGKDGSKIFNKIVS